MIIWSGYGILTPVIALSAFMTVFHVVGLVHQGLGAFLGFSAAPAAVWYAGRFFKKKNCARSLYFIPMEYWAIPMALIILFFMVSCLAHQIGLG